MPCVCVWGHRYAEHSYSYNILHILHLIAAAAMELCVFTYACRTRMPAHESSRGALAPVSRSLAPVHDIAAHKTRRPVHCIECITHAHTYRNTPRTHTARVILRVFVCAQSPLVCELYHRRSHVRRTRDVCCACARAPFYVCVCVPVCLVRIYTHTRAARAHYVVRIVRGASVHEARRRAAMGKLDSSKML